LLLIVHRLDVLSEKMFIIFFGTPAVFLHTQIVNQTALIVS